MVAHVEAQLQRRDLGAGGLAPPLDGAQAIEQDIGVQLLKSAVPQKPSGACRITLGKLAGLTFKPVNVRSDTSGNYWEFEVVKVNA